MHSGKATSQFLPDLQAEVGVSLRFMMKLVRPNLTHEAAAKEFVASFRWNDNDIFFLRELDRYVHCNYRAWLRYIEKIRRRHHFIQYFCIENNQIIGMVEIRYAREHWLIARFGHIGYILSPQYRGKGYAKCMLHLALKIAMQMTRSPIVITCDDDNVPSYKTIKRCGGVLKAKFRDPSTEKIKRQYIVWRNKQ